MSPEARTERIALSWPRDVKEVEAAEQHVRDVLTHAPLKPIFDDEAEYAWWVEHLGASKVEFHEAAQALARSYHRTPFWQHRRRRALRARYIRMEALQKAGSGLETVWR
jgi:hypothetical protein